MRRQSSVLVAIILAPLLVSSTTPLCHGRTASPAKEDLAFVNVNILPGTCEGVREGYTVVIRGDKIRAVGPSRKTPVQPKARVVNAAGRYLIPGLWDAHVHLSRAGESSLPLFLSNGITSVRDMGSDFAQVRRWREAIASGARAGPRIRTPGPMLEAKRFVDFLRKMDEESKAAGYKPTGYLHLPLETVEDARREVDALARLGVDFIKVRSVPSAEVAREIVARAHSLNLPVAAHAEEALVEEALPPHGALSVEHLLWQNFVFKNLKPAGREALAARFARESIFVVPTIVGERSRQVPNELVAGVLRDARGARDERRRYLSPELLQDWRQMLWEREQEKGQGTDWKAIIDSDIAVLREMHRAGVPMMAGTDQTPLVYPGFSLHDELESLVREVGMTPCQALRSAALNPAKFFGLEDELGTIEAGRLADLVLLDANPLEDIRNTRRVRAVVVGGKLLDRKALDKLLTWAAARAGS